MYERTITIDIDRPYTSRIPSVQCDSGRKVKVKLTNQGKPMDLTGTRVVLACVKPDGHEIFNDTEIVDKTKGEVTFILTEQINAEAGQVRSVLKLYDGNALVTSKEFFISVDASVGTSVAPSSDELNALTNALNEVQDIDNRFAQTNAQLSELANKGTTVEVLERVTKEEIDRQIADGTLATLMIADGSITQEKLSPDLELGVKANSITRHEINEDVYKEIDIHRVTGSYSNSNWIQITLKNDAIIPVGSVLNISFKAIGFKGVKSGTTGVYKGGTIYTNEFTTTTDNLVTQSLTFSKEYNNGNIDIIFHPNIVEDSAMFALEDLIVDDYEILSVGVFQKTYPYEKLNYYDDTLITRKDVDEKIDNIELKNNSIDSNMLKSEIIDSIHYKKGSVDTSHINPHFYTPFNGIRVLNRPAYLSYKMDISSMHIKQGDILEIELTLLDNTLVHEGGNAYNSLAFSFWGAGIENVTSNTSTRALSFDTIKETIDNLKSFKTLKTTLTSTTDISTPYLHLYASLNLPASNFNVDTLIKYTFKINGIKVDTVSQGIYNSPNGLCKQVKYLDNQLLSVEYILEEIERNKQEAINEAINRTMVENCWLYKKRWGIMGDSLSDPGYPQSLDVYWRKISEKYNMEIDKQAASGASTTNGHGTATQVENLSGEFDLITVWIGTNDAQTESTSAESFRQNIEALIRRIYERFPTTKIFFITPLANQKTTDPQDEDITKGVYLYVQAIKEVCTRYSIPVLDLYSNSNLNPHMGALNDTFYAGSDKCHMNSRGYLERINPIIENFLINQR